jgi:putative flippase GtrA
MPRPSLTSYGNPNLHWSSPEVRFLVVGGLNTAFGYGVFALLIWLGLGHPAAIGLATVIGVAFNFQSTGRLVFGGAPLSRLGRFIAVYVFTYGINVAAVSALLRFDLNVYLANAIVVLPLAAITFMLQRKFVFPAP